MANASPESSLARRWKASWLTAAEAADVAVCVLSSSYLQSRESCEEWRAVSDAKRVVVVNGSSIEEMAQVPATDFNGVVQAFLKTGDGIIFLDEYEPGGDITDIVVERIADIVSERMALASSAL
mmetsp:Transcript_29295/g.50550  ORF Transcript_29295/g.50550 Transcript_29295/m.50550 type:complete len:124 (+) Transcript_29295:394-765(+)